MTAPEPINRRQPAPMRRRDIAKIAGAVAVVVSAALAAWQGVPAPAAPDYRPMTSTPNTSPPGASRQDVDQIRADIARLTQEIRNLAAAVRDLEKNVNQQP